ncbi:cupredoxin domain-containing protein [Kutzneria sp. CA-103260]|uniref:cupredoxin domain-containing protein n=1 Tax=Kutzneria sp. CA-103260 TaxID=2802641 RepID=UPI001BA74D1B|nr:cupredoxin family copper-binding protein [Kutzneria sp. CA-103260]QUQ62968.1 copper binding protein of plastocyanin/azurin family protein [Kutzneria sp. CA-103260]
MTRRLLSVLLVLPLLTLLAPISAAAGQAVTMAQYAFAPAALTVHVGDTITWTNQDQAPHDVTTTSGPVSVHSPTLSTGQSWTYTFTQPGAYSYICSIHPDMKAQITVLAPAPTTTRPTTAAATTAARRPATAGAPVEVIRPTTAVAPPTTTAPATSDSPQAMQAMAPTEQSTLDPMLLVAGLVAAVATLCLLLIASRPAE